MLTNNLIKNPLKISARLPTSGGNRILIFFMPTSYSKITTLYTLSMKLSGFARCLESYIRRLPIQLPLNARILDVGCGTGILGISMKNSFLA